VSPASRTTAARLTAALVAALVAAVALAGCSLLADDLPEAEPVPAPTLQVPAGAEQATDPAYARYYGQQPDWQGCGEPAECATVTVPVDWDDPAGGTLQLALARVRADGDRQGSLVLNFGGPGVPGAGTVREIGTRAVGEAVAGAYDLVGVDPRGVGRSSGVDCLSDAELDDWRAFGTEADPDEDLTAAVAELREAAEGFARGCAASAGPLLAHLDTVSAARDLDVVRDALGEERLDYLGYSYGTLLGATYADRFPQRVDRFVLDGALDPASSYTDLVAGQAAGIELALGSYAQACLDGDVGRCPLEGDADEAVEQVVALVEQVDDAPLPTTREGRELTGGLAFTGVVAPLYDRGSWEQLTEALTAALDDGDGTALLDLADSYSDRDPSGRYTSNTEEAFTAINCVDYPVDDSPEALVASAEQIEREAPLVGPLMTYGEVLCGAWPVPAARDPAPVRAPGAPPVLVLGTTGDPATPYAWAEALADQLEQGVLVTRGGEGHTAYGRGSRCVDASVEAWLVRGRVVADGTRCTS
jgi:pimeloyl-ACP methyl ester carboxylesterase